MIGALNQKLMRDLWNIKGQMGAIVLVMAAGIAVFVIMFGVLDSLRLTQQTYYERYLFADVFASLKRAPESLHQKVNEIPGVSMVETRIVFPVTLQMDSMLEPGSGKIISLPDSKPPLLNQLYLRAGRFLIPNEENAVLVDEGFFQAHQLKLGDKVTVILNGLKRRLKVVGVVLSPEYVYSIAPGALMPDSRRYGIFWMSRRALEAAVNMKSAFNDLAVKTERFANLESIKLAIDKILKPYGGLIAYSREEQLSNFFVENELKQLESLGMMAPIVFLSVAAFLINVVISRQIATQREQIGMLKAVGYHDFDISVHYLKMILLVCFIGSFIGLFLGIWMGAGMTEMYTAFFHFPILKFSFSLQVMLLAVFSCLFAAIVGTLLAIRHAAKLPPAEAMRPPSPPEFRTSFLEKLGLHQHLSFFSRMILRQIERRPLRSVFSAIGLAFSISILIFSFFMEDSIDYMLDIQYDLTQREDLNVAFVEPRPLRSLEELKVIPGILKVEVLREVPVYFRSAHFNKRSSITGLNHSPDLRRVINKQLSAITIPEQGLLLNEKLAEILHLKVGDSVEIEILQGKRQVKNVVVSEIVQEFIGVGAFMNLNSLNQLLDEAPQISGASILLDSNASALIYQKLKQIPAIVGLNIVSVLRQIFEQIMAENLLKMVSTNIIFASFISFGVIYNTARIALSERGRELASLRVLGLTRKEVAALLFGELSIITVIAIPLGIVIGQLLVSGMVLSLDSELYRIPDYIEKSTYGFAVLIVLASTLVSFYLVWRRVENIDLVSAQKGVD